MIRLFNLKHSSWVTSTSTAPPSCKPPAKKKATVSWQCRSKESLLWKTKTIQSDDLLRQQHLITVCHANLVAKIMIWDDTTSTNALSKFECRQSQNNWTFFVLFFNSRIWEFLLFLKSTFYFVQWTQWTWINVFAPAQATCPFTLFEHEECCQWDLFLFKPCSLFHFSRRISCIYSFPDRSQVLWKY